MPQPFRRCIVLTLLCALVFQLGAAAAAGLPSQSCCGTCDAVTAHVALMPDGHCAAPDDPDGHDAAGHRHGSGPCPLCGDHHAALAPFVLVAGATVAAVVAPNVIVAWRPSALPAPMPDRLERPPRLA